MGASDPFDLSKSGGTRIVFWPVYPLIWAVAAYKMVQAKGQSISPLGVLIGLGEIDLGKTWGCLKSPTKDYWWENNS
jgi:hypothetical protein